MRKDQRTATGVPGKPENQGRKNNPRLLTGLKKLPGTLNRCSRRIYRDLRTVTPLGWR